MPLCIGCLRPAGNKHRVPTVSAWKWNYKHRRLLPAGRRHSVHGSISMSLLGLLKTTFWWHIACGDHSLAPHARCASLHFRAWMGVKGGNQGDGVHGSYHHKRCATRRLVGADPPKRHSAHNTKGNSWSVHAEVTAEKKALHSGVHCISRPTAL